VTSNDPPEQPVNQPAVDPPFNPPQHQFAQYHALGAEYAQSRNSAAAITSLILGILGCVPMITSVTALVFAIVGIRATRDNQMRGRGMAIAGLILGLIGILGWGLAGTAGFVFYQSSRPASAVAKQFTIDMSNGDVVAAGKVCDKAITPAELDKLAEQFKSWGPYSNLTLSSRFASTMNGQTTWRLDGQADFSTGTKFAQFVLVKQSDGSYKITRAFFQ
jgi:hypothetical protein